MSNLLKHIWQKIYFNVDLPPDRNSNFKYTNRSQLTLKTVLLEFFFPTTKRKTSLRAWLGINGNSYALYKTPKSPIPKALIVIVLDIALWVPRLAANILKLVTEVLPLSLRELAYAGFQSMLEETKRTDGVEKKLYQAAALICWLFTSLFSCVYFIGCLLTSPGRTIPAILETFNKLGWPVLGTVIAIACAAFVVGSHAALLMTGLWFIFPSVALTILNSGWIGALATSLLMAVDGFGLIFNTNPNQPNLTVEFSKKGELNCEHLLSDIPTGGWKLPRLTKKGVLKDTNISIPPDEFIKIFSDKYEPVKTDKGNDAIPNYEHDYVSLT